MPALSWMDTGSYSWSDGQPAFRRPPGYPALLVGMFSFFGKSNLLSVVILQNVIVFGTTMFVVYMALRLGGIAAMVISVLFFLTHFTTFYYSNEVLNETVFTFLLTLSTLFVVLALDLKARYLVWIMAAGIVLTLATFVRPVSMYLFYPFALMLSAFVYLRTRNWRLTIRAGILFLLPWVILGGLWHVRNLQKLDKFQFVSQHRQVFHERSSILIAKLENISKLESRKFYVKYLSTSNATPIDHLKFYASYPLQYLKMSATSVAITLFSPAQWHFVSYFQDYPTERIPLTGKLLSGDFSGALGIMQNWEMKNIALLIGIIVHSIVLFIGALIPLVMWFYRRDLEYSKLIIFYLTISYMLALVFVWGGAARFGVPNIPFMAILAGIGYGSLIEPKLNNIKWRDSNTNYIDS